MTGQLIDEKALIERIRSVREQYAGKRGKALFAKALGVSPSTYAYYEDARVPPAGILWRICEVAGVDVQWLLTGRERSGAGSAGQVPAALAEKIGAVLQRQPRAAAALDAFVDLLAAEGPTADASMAVAAGQRCWVPVLGRTAAGMVHFWQGDEALPDVTKLGDLIERHRDSRRREVEGGPVDCEPESGESMRLDAGAVSLVQLAEVQAGGVCEFVESAQICQRYRDAFGLRVDGDSMGPHVGDGDIVILSPSVPARNGGRAVVKLKGQIGVTCKIVRWEEGQIHLVPSNERYEVKVCEQKEVVWALAVLWRIRFSGG